MKNVFASIVCYNPDISKLKRNVSSISNQVECVLIIDNGSKNRSSYQQLLKEYSDIVFISLPENMGIAYALNRALDYCKGKCHWLITLDQDSYAATDMVDSLMNYSNIYKVAIISPKIVDINYNVDSVQNKSDCLEIMSAITSGCLNNVEVLDECGGFSDKLFIDYVDHEICLRLNSNGYKVLQTTNAVLYQEVGKISSHSFMGISVATTNHSPFRRYFLFRNKIYVHKKYFFRYPIWCLKDMWESLKTLIRIVIFESYRRKNLRCINRGIIDGIFGYYDNRWPFTIV